MITSWVLRSDRPPSARCHLALPVPRPASAVAAQAGPRGPTPRQRALSSNSKAVSLHALSRFRKERHSHKVCPERTACHHRGHYLLRRQATQIRVEMRWDLPQRAEIVRGSTPASLRFASGSLVLVLRGVCVCVCACEHASVHACAPHSVEAQSREETQNTSNLRLTPKNSGLIQSGKSSRGRKEAPQSRRP